MFNNSDSYDSEDDVDYIPSGDESEDDDTEQQIESSPGISTVVDNSKKVVTDERKPITDKTKDEDVWKKFLKDAEADSCKSKCVPETNNSCSVIEKSKPNENALPKCEKSNYQLDASSSKLSIAPTDEKKNNSNKRSSLEMVVGKINKKAKVTTLQKSRDDWNSFIQDEGIEESLRRHNKGKMGYLERQTFLLKSDVATFEKERAIRLAKK